MKRKLIILVVLIISLFITGCGHDTSKIKGSSKDNKHITDFLLDNIVDDNGRTSNNQFFMFSKNGKFIYNKSTEIRFNKPKVILFIKGSWKLKDNNLILKQEEMVYQSLDATKTEYEAEYTTIDNTIEFNDLKLESDSNGTLYLNGDKCAIMKKTNNNKDYLKEIKYYLEHDIKNVDLDKLKKLENKK